MKYLNFLFVLAPVFILEACNKTEQLSVTLMHYNVGVFDKYEDSSIETIACAVRELGADAVSLNEVDSCTFRTGQVDQMSAFAAEMGGWNCHYAAAMQYDGGAYGIGIASKPMLRIVSTDMVPLSKLDGQEPRVMAVVEYEDFVFASVHLDLTEKSQIGHVKAICRYADSLSCKISKPMILCGDFNCEPDSAPIALMKQTWSLLTPESLTYPSDNPVKCIDYIFMRHNGRTVSVKSAYMSSELSSVDLSTASDHLPLAVSITIMQGRER